MLLYGPSRDFWKLQWMGTFIVKAFADCTFSLVPFTNLCPFSERMAKAEAFVRCRKRGRWLLSRKKGYLNLSDTQHCGILAYSYRSTGNQVFQVSELKISQKVSRTSHKTASFKLGMQEVWESREMLSGWVVNLCKKKKTWMFFPSVLSFSSGMNNKVMIVTRKNLSIYKVDFLCLWQMAVCRSMIMVYCFLTDTKSHQTAMTTSAKRKQNNAYFNPLRAFDIHSVLLW